eukprot:5425752-Amphidinium_carterae.1
MSMHTKHVELWHASSLQARKYVRKEYVLFCTKLVMVRRVHSAPWPNAVCKEATCRAKTELKILIRTCSGTSPFSTSMP